MGEEVEREILPEAFSEWQGEFLFTDAPGNASCLLNLGAASVGLWDLSLSSGMEDVSPPAVEVHSLNHGITREVHSSAFYWPHLGHMPKTMNHGQVI